MSAPRHHHMSILHPRRTPLRNAQGSPPPKSPINKQVDAPTPSTISSPHQPSSRREHYKALDFGPFEKQRSFEESLTSFRGSEVPTGAPSTRSIVSKSKYISPVLAGRDSASHTRSPSRSLPRFSWRLARAYILLKIQPAETFSVCGVPFAAWPKTKIPTLGASPAGGRVQEMYKVILPGVGPRGKDVRLFVKVVPVDIWKSQWEAENKWNGEYATDGENFVMEAAVLAFLHEYAPGIAPKLVGILELSLLDTNQRPRGSTRRTMDSNVSHMVIISELYGEDLLDYLDRRDRKQRPLLPEQKRALQLGCALLMKRLHSLGLAHLDFTPENVLVGADGLRLCDFAKTTPIWSPNLRHIPSNQNASSTLNAFESCEPTVGKGAYMPPECWKVYWKLETQKILKPLDDLAALRLPEERAQFYFKVSSADVYMLGVLIFWIWSEGGIWRISDPRQDEKFYHLVKSGMNFDLFRECRSWPAALKDCVSKTLRVEAFRRATITEVSRHPWFMEILEREDAPELIRPFVDEHTHRGLFYGSGQIGADRETEVADGLDEE